jgi:hypothetical protein
LGNIGVQKEEKGAMGRFALRISIKPYLGIRFAHRFLEIPCNLEIGDIFQQY